MTCPQATCSGSIPSAVGEPSALLRAGRVPPLGDRRDHVVVEPGGGDQLRQADAALGHPLDQQPHLDHGAYPLAWIDPGWSAERTSGLGRPLPPSRDREGAGDRLGALHRSLTLAARSEPRSARRRCGRRGARRCRGTRPPSIQPPIITGTDAGEEGLARRRRTGTARAGLGTVPQGPAAVVEVLHSARGMRRVRSAGRTRLPERPASRCSSDAVARG